MTVQQPPPPAPGAPEQPEQKAPEEKAPEERTPPKETAQLVPEEEAPPASEQRPAAGAAADAAADAAAQAPSPALAASTAAFTAPLDAAAKREEKDVADDAPAPPAPYGLALKAARERMGVRPADVAASLHLEESVIRAMEEGREDELPARVYVRGYIRAYANLLGLDADQLAAQFDKLAPAHETAATPVVGAAGKRAVRADLPQRRAGVILGVVVVIIVVALAGTLWGVWRSFDWSFVTDAADEMRAAPPWRSEPSERDGSGTPTSASDDGRAAAADGGESARPEQASAPVATLEFTFKENSWVEVHDRSRMVYGELGTAGESVSVAGHPPFTIAIGYAAGVELRYRGEVIALAPHTQGGVANLVVH